MISYEIEFWLGFGFRFGFGFGFLDFRFGCVISFRISMRLC